MWDAELVTRVKDRKLNEILIFASLAKIDQEKIDTYIDIIVSLGDDIDACDILLDTNGESEIALDSIDCDEYLTRLSPSEKADEDAFDAMKSEPEVIADETDMDYVKQLISEAVDSIVKERSSQSAAPSGSGCDVSALEAEIGQLKSENEKLKLEAISTKQLTTELDEAKSKIKELEEKVESMKDATRSTMDELAIARKRNEDLSAELDYAKESIATVESERDELRALIDSKDDAAEAVSGCADEPAAAPAVEPVVEQQPEQPKSEPAPKSEDPAAVDAILTDEDKENLVRIIDMKSRKIDDFVDMMIEGKVSEDVSDDIVSFLKDDIKICKSLLMVDCSSFDKIITGLSNVLDVVEASPQSRYEKIYRSTLTPEEKAIDASYVDILSRIHAVISSRYLPYIRGVVS